MRIVTVIKTKIKEGFKHLVLEVLKDDIQEHITFTLPGIESTPVKGDKVLLEPTVTKGKSIAFNIPLKTDITDGEIKINGRTEAGSITGSLYINKEGKIEIGLKNFQGMILETFKPLFDNHEHPLDLSNLLAKPTPIKIPQTSISSTVKVEQ